MFGHATWMQKMTRGCFIETGDLSSGTGSVADSQGDSGSTENNGTEDGQQDTGGETGTGEGEADNAGQQQQRTSKQSPETDAAFAKMRREADEAKRELQRRDAWVAQTFGNSHGITTWAQYEVAVAQSVQHEAQRKQDEVHQRAVQQFNQKVKEAEAAGWDVKPFLEMLQNDPEKIQLKQALAQLQTNISRQEQQRRQEQQQQAFINRINRDHAWLKSKYGDMVPELDKLQEIDPETIRLMQGNPETGEPGLPLKSAWLEANVDKITDRTKRATKQQTLNNIDSKKHLKTEGDGASDNDGDINIPEETMQYYLDNNFTKKQAQAHYKKLYGR